MKCPYPSCDYDTGTEIPEDGSIELKLQLLGIHERGVHPINTQPVQQAAPRTEKFSRPKLELKDGMVSEEDWEFFCTAGQNTRDLRIQGYIVEKFSV